MRRWLKLLPSPTRTEAVVAALLEPDWLEADPQTLISTLRRRVNRLHRDFRLITETQLNRRSIVSLDHVVPASVSDGGLVTLADTVADPATFEATVLGCDES